MPNNLKTYMLSFALSMGAYAVALLVSLKILAAGVESKPLEITVALSPMLPCIAVLWVIIRYIRTLDEMQRRIQLDAMVFTSAATALLTFSYGFLEGIGFPQMPTFVILPLMCALWQFGVMIARLRYR